MSHQTAFERADLRLDGTMTMTEGRLSDRIRAFAHRSGMTGLEEIIGVRLTIRGSPEALEMGGQQAMKRLKPEQQR